ncbi:hypothetical protein BCR44DRAFT_75446 [Catenaria anguillulae PL171]|uniref:Uncharacterized protein n=1 Tax=Catenaria anguillulae PL171 TaxID=765915 RepID=A0A1Y2HED7_9FUNG|nr:hypothetical protein BCR44DRAFT_75446 [Catenaria anguillulae PL171]
MESIALMSIQTDYRPLFMSSPLLGPLITMFRNPAILSALSPSLAFGFATLIHHLTMYPPRLTPEQRQLRRLAQFAQSGGRGAPPPKSTDENDEEARKQEDAITDRCLVLVKEHKVMVSLVGVYRSQSRLAQGSLSTSLSSTLGSIACHLAQTESLRGLLVQQGLVGMLVRIAPSDRAAAQALARCGITLNPAIAFGEQHVTSVANSLWTLVVPPPVTGGLLESKNQQQPMHDSSLAHYESLLAITNLATLPTLGPHLGDWFIRLDRSDSLLADNLDIRRAAWELLCNMVWTSPDVLEKCVDNPRRLRLVLDMAVAHSHHDEEPAMRRAVLGVLAALTCCAPVVQYLAEHVSERSSEEGQKQEDVVAVTHLERIMAVSKREKDVEMMHRLSQMWVHVVEDEQVGRAWGRKMGLSKVLDGFVKQAKGHGGVVGLVGEAMKSL